MRKTSLLLLSCTAVVAFLGFSTQAFAVSDPACEPYGNAFGIFDLAIDTTDSHREHAISGITGSGVACGSVITNGFGGQDTLNDYATITTAPGAVVAPAGLLTDQAFVGKGIVNVLSYLPNGIAIFSPDNPFNMKVDKNSGTDCPGSAVVCYKGTTTGAVAGHNWNWVTEDPTTGRNVLTIGPFYNDSLGTPAGLTHLQEFTLCAQQGSVGGTTCGSGSSPYVQANGDASAPDCNGGTGPNGIYTATVTNKGGVTSAPTSVCVVWTAANNKGGKKIEQPPADE